MEACQMIACAAISLKLLSSLCHLVRICFWLVLLLTAGLIPNLGNLLKVVCEFDHKIFGNIFQDMGPQESTVARCISLSSLWCCVHGLNDIMLTEPRLNA